ncbi:MAG: AI-2E family transporter [Candidatus Binatia bacterium]
MLFAAFAVVLLWLAYLARWAVLLVYLSALIAVGISPLAAWVERRRIPGTALHPPRWVAALAVYLMGFGALAGIGAAVVPKLIDQAQELARNWPSLLRGAEQFLIRHHVLDRPMSMGELVQQLPVDLGGMVLQQFWTVVGGILGILLILVLSLYLLHDAQQLRDVLLCGISRRRRPRVRHALDQIASQIGAWMTGQLMLSAIIGGTTALALGLMGVPYFYVLAVLASVGELIPYAGPIIAAVPGVLLAFTVSWELGLAVLGFYVAQQQLENHLLVPKLMQHQVGLRPSIVIIAITIGSAVLGVLGAIIAVPTAVILQVAVRALAPQGGELR